MDAAPRLPFSVLLAILAAITLVPAAALAYSAWVDATSQPAYVQDAVLAALMAAAPLGSAAVVWFRGHSPGTAVEARLYRTIIVTLVADGIVLLLVILLAAPFL